MNQRPVGNMVPREGFKKADMAQLATLVTHNERLKVPLPLRLIDEDSDYLHR